jgi:hypothetical protein
MSFLEIFQPGLKQFAAARTSRFESTAVVVARRGKNASARSASVRRRAISDARSGVREERDRQKMLVVRPSYGGRAPMGIDLDAGKATISTTPPSQSGVIDP